MSHHGRRFLSRGAPLLLLVFFCLTAANNAQTPAATPAPDNKVPVMLTIDPTTYKVTASPDRSLSITRTRSMRSGRSTLRARI